MLGLQFFCRIAWSLNCLPSQETPASIFGSNTDLSNPTPFQQPPCAAHPRSKTYRIGFGVKYFYGVRRGLGLIKKVLTWSTNFLNCVHLPNSIYAVFFSTYITRIKCINKKGMSRAYSSVGRGLALHASNPGFHPALQKPTVMSQVRSSSIRKMKAKRSEVQDCPGLHSKFKVSLLYVRF